MFEKTRGTRGSLAVGDEFVVRMPGPWDGPVRVIACSPASFRFATLRGHLEAGQIEFTARDEADGLVFEIESWARPGDRLSHLLYNRLRLAKEIQLNLWVETCLQLGARSGGRVRGGVRVHTRRLADPGAALAATCQAEPVLARALDTVLDRTIAPGFSRLGYLLRSAGFTGDRSDPGPGALRGRVALVTGASAGLGTATVEGLARLGAGVHLVVRDAGRGERARAAVAAAVPGAELHVSLCDLSSLADVRRAGAELAGARPDVLVHNAGVLPPRRIVTPEGHELAFATHVLGPHLLTASLAPALAPGGRVVFVSSGGMYARKLALDDVASADVPYSGTAAYARTKRMQVVLAGMWARQLAAQRVTVHSLHPGWADTPGLTGSLPAFRRVLGPMLRTPAEGADTAVWLAAAPAAAIGTGGFWHDRRARPEHYVPWTRESPGDRERLWELCERLTR